MKATITERGQVSIPAQLRRDMHLTAGRTVIWEQVSPTEARVVVQAPAAIKADPVAAVGFAQRHGLPGGTTAQWMKELREGEED